MRIRITITATEMNGFTHLSQRWVDGGGGPLQKGPTIKNIDNGNIEPDHISQAMISISA